ncbi:MAG: SH3 domain-containing protein [Pseudomonadota bacterium]
MEKAAENPQTTSNQITMKLFSRIFNKIPACFILSIFISIAVIAQADQIVPNDRVTSRLNVRGEPSTNSQVVGKLKPDESASLLDVVPYWYRVKLNNGTQGYVSKAWSDLIHGTVEYEKTIRLGSWNIKKLGHGNNKNYAVLAQIIEANFDIVVVIEVMQKQHVHPGYNSLLTALGSNWVGIITNNPRPNNEDSNSEYYAILYRSSIIRPCTGWNNLIYHKDNDGSGNSYGNDMFSREPAFFCFEVPVNNTSIGVDFLIAAYHARWSCGNISEISDEVRHINEVFKSMANSRPGEKDLFIAGDFNLKPNQLNDLVSFHINTQGSGSTLNSDGQRTSNLYDHLVIYDKAASSEIICNPEVLDVMGSVSDGKVFYNTISDHLPIIAILSASGPDDD